MKKIALACLIAITGSSGALASPAITSFNLPSIFVGGDFVVGYQFTATDNQNVTALGYYDQDQNGLAVSHNVGIYDIAGNLLASSAVGPGSYLLSGFRYVDLASAFSLNGGSQYRIAGTTASNDGWVFQAEDIATNGISYGGSYFADGSSLAFPSKQANTREYLTVNFLTAAGAVPEPTTWAMMLLGFGAIGFATRRRKEKGLSQNIRLSYT